MQTLYDSQAKADILRRLSNLQPSSPRQWGKMTVAQMLAHCAAAVEVPCGDRLEQQVFIGRMFGRLALIPVLGAKPMTRNAPTSAALRVEDQRDFAKERERLTELVERFCARGSAAAEGVAHSFFGRLTGQQWGCLVYKHLDHHLRQFGA
ncbi:MAG TPA: DUF1569 domain-containing protein [Vicinamibacterales bacterium]|jgi:hypothetical protein